MSTIAARRHSGRPVAVVVALALAASGCATPEPARPKTQVEVRQLQTRDFDTADARLVLAAMLNVLQDEGYVVSNAQPDIGLLVATKEIDLSSPATASDEPTTGQILLGVVVVAAVIAALAVLASQDDEPYYSAGGGTSSPPARPKIEILNCTANVSSHGEQTRVRVSFQRKVIDDRGGTFAVETVEDPVFYQDFFAKVDKALFLEAEGL